MEGADRSGKTFAAQKLSKKFNIPIFKGTRAPKSAEELRIDRSVRAQIETETIYEFLKQTGYSVIIDRFFLSELVYSKVYGRPVDESFIWDIDAKFADLKAIIVYMDTPIDVIKSRWSGETLVKFDDAVKIIDMYNRVIENTKCKVIRYRGTRSEDTIRASIKFS